MRTPSKAFSVEEANQLIPEVEFLIERILAKKEEQSRLHDFFLMEELLTEVLPSPSSEDQNLGLDQMAYKIDSVLAEIQRDVQRIISLGGIVRNLDQGYVDFFGYAMEQNPVYFSWRRGDEMIRYYRPAEEPESEPLPL